MGKKTIEEMKEEMEQLKAVRAELSKKIAKLWYEINYAEKKMNNYTPLVVENTKAYQITGKRYSEMNDEEKREYNKQIQKDYRARVGGKNDEQ